MTFLTTLKKLLFGETWLLPAGLGIALAATLVVRRALGAEWHELGGFLLLALVLAVFVVSVDRSTPR